MFRLAIIFCLLAGGAAAQDAAGKIIAVAEKAELVLLRITDVSAGDELFIIRDGQTLAKAVINKVISPTLANASVDPPEAVGRLRKGDEVYRQAPRTVSPEASTLPQITPETRSKTDAILQEIASKAAQIRDFSAITAMDIVQDGLHSKGSQQIDALLPDMYKIVATSQRKDMPQSTTVLFNGHEQWVITDIGGLRKIIRYDIDRVDDALADHLPPGTSYADLRNPIIQMLFTQQTIDSYRRSFELVFVDTTALENRSAYVIQAFPRSEAVVTRQVLRATFGEEVASIKFWVGTVDGFVYRSQVLSPSGNVLQWQEVSRTRFNLGLKPDEFSYSPHEGETVEDGTDKLIRQELERLAALSQPK